MRGPGYPRMTYHAGETEGVYRRREHKAKVTQKFRNLFFPGKATTAALPKSKASIAPSLTQGMGAIRKLDESRQRSQKSQRPQLFSQVSQAYQKALSSGKLNAPKVYPVEEPLVVTGTLRKSKSKSKSKSKGKGKGKGKITPSKSAGKGKNKVTPSKSAGKGKITPSKKLRNVPKKSSGISKRDVAIGAAGLGAGLLLSSLFGRRRKTTIYNRTTNYYIPRRGSRSWN